MQQANNAMTSEQMQLYVMVFLGYFQQIQVWDRYDVIDRDDETLWSISPLNQKLLKRRLAYQTGLDDVQSETQFEIEALRWEDEPLEDEELVELFVRAFGTYYNFWDAYFGEEEEELEEG